MNALTVQQQFGVSDMERMARALANSKLFGVQNVEQALALCLIAQAEGRHPASASSDYHIISGRPSKKADAMLRDFLLNGGKVEWHSLTDELADATFSHPAGGTLRITWDAARVKQAGIQNAMHGKYPRQMLRARVVSEGVRSVFPAATSGMYVPEENEAIEPRNVTPAPIVETRRQRSPEVTPFDAEPQAEPEGPSEDAQQWIASIARQKTVKALGMWREANGAEIETMEPVDRDAILSALNARHAELADA